MRTYADNQDNADWQAPTNRGQQERQGLWPNPNMQTNAWGQRGSGTPGFGAAGSGGPWLSPPAGNTNMARGHGMSVPVPALASARTSPSQTMGLENSPLREHGNNNPANADAKSAIPSSEKMNDRSDGDPNADADSPEPAGVRLPFRVTITGPLSAEELLREVVRQFYGVAKYEDVPVALRSGWRWVHPEKPPVVSQSDLAAGYKYVWVNDINIAPATEAEVKGRAKSLKQMPKGYRDAMTDEAYRRFWKKTQYKPGQRLGSSASDKSMAPYYDIIHDSVVRDRQLIDALPDQVRDAFMDKDRLKSIQPAEFETVLRIAHTLQGLTPEELAEYRNRATTNTDNLFELEGAVNAFVEERKRRRANEEKMRTAGTRLYGLDALYDEYVNYKALESTAHYSVPPPGGSGLGLGYDIWKLREELETKLVTAGIKGGIPEFERLIATYQRTFIAETVDLAHEMLDRYEHVLLTEQARFMDYGAALKLAEAVKMSGAREKYTGFNTGQLERLDRTGNPNIGPLNLKPNTIGHHGGSEPDARDLLHRAEQHQQGERAVLSVAKDNPLVSNPDFNRELLAHLPPGMVQGFMQTYIAERLEGVRNTRNRLTADSEMVYKLGIVVAASKQRQHVEPHSMYDKIIDGYIGHETSSEEVIKTVLGVLAIAASFMGPLGQLAAFGISAYLAADELDQFQMQKDAYLAGLLTDEPSMFWVAIAIAGTVLDLTAALKAFKAVEPAVKAFNATGDLGKFTTELHELQQAEQFAKANRLSAHNPMFPVKESAEISDEVVESLIRAAKSRADARSAWKALVGAPKALRSVVVAGSEEFGKLVYAVYLSIRSKLHNFQAFVKMDEAIELLGDVRRFTPEEMALLKEGYQRAYREANSLLDMGKQLKLTDEELEGVFKMRIAPDLAANPTKGQVRFKRLMDFCGDDVARLERLAKASGDSEQLIRLAGITESGEQLEQFLKFIPDPKELRRVLRTTGLDGGVDTFRFQRLMKQMGPGTHSAADIEKALEELKVLDGKILYGRAKVAPAPGQKIQGDARVLIGGHSAKILNDPTTYNIDPMSIVYNADKTIEVKVKKLLSTNPVDVWSKTKTRHTLAPSTWSDDDILRATDYVAGQPAVYPPRLRDGATLHREIVNSVEWEVIKDVHGVVVSSYPTGGKPTALATFVGP